MFVLQPSSSVCYPLNLPIAPGPNLDEATRKKLTLECRTGAAVELARSGVFVHGGLTLPLNLPVINSLQLQKELYYILASIKIEIQISKRWPIG